MLSRAQSVLAPASLSCRNQGMRPPRVASFLLGQKSQQHGPWLGSMLIGSAGTFLTISCPLHLPCPGSVIWTLLLSPPPFAASSVPDSPPIPLPPLWYLKSAAQPSITCCQFSKRGIRGEVPGGCPCTGMAEAAGPMHLLLLWCRWASFPAFKVHSSVGPGLTTALLEQIRNLGCGYLDSWPSLPPLPQWARSF